MKRDRPHRDRKPIRSHFAITVGHTSIAYCYIRKNACSAWKQLFVQESPHGYVPADWERDIDFMAAKHGLRTLDEVEQCERRVVVLRDPVDRYISAFVNLIVMNARSTRLKRKLSRRMHGGDVASISFDELLDEQLPRPGTRRNALNKHFWPQTWHLAPTVYTDVIDIHHLAAAMKRLIGEEKGSRYFDRPVNATTAAAYEDDAAPSLSAKVLIERYQSIGSFPGKASFMRGGRAERIKEAYAEDAALYAACVAHAKTHPAAGFELRFDPAPPHHGRMPRRRRKGRPPPTRTA